MSRLQSTFAPVKTTQYRKDHRLWIAANVVLILASAACQNQKVDPMRAPTVTPTHWGERVVLPPPVKAGRTSLEEALMKRRSVREFSSKPLTEAEVGQMLWAAQGITDPDGLRTAPSAGALYPLELYVATGDGVFHYDPQAHQLQRRSPQDARRALHHAGLEQDALLHAPAVFVIAAVYARTARKYGPDRSPRYVQLEAGHSAQNLLLQAVTLGLGAVPMGAFKDAAVHDALKLPSDEQPLYLIPAGHPLAR